MGQGFFRFFAHFGTKMRVAIHHPHTVVVLGVHIHPPLGGYMDPPYPYIYAQQLDPKTAILGVVWGSRFGPPLDPYPDPPKGPPGGPPGGPPRGAPPARARAPGAPPGRGRKFPDFRPPRKIPIFGPPGDPPRDPLFGPPFGPPFGTPTADYCGGGEAPPATPPSLGDRSFGMASARPLLLRPRSGRHPEADSQRRRMARPGSAIRGGA